MSLLKQDSERIISKKKFRRNHLGHKLMNDKMMIACIITTGEMM